MAVHQHRHANEFASHSWDAANPRDLDYALSFNIRGELLIATGRDRPTEPLYLEELNDFGFRLVSLLIQVEQAALNLSVAAYAREGDSNRRSDLEMHMLEEARHLSALQRYMAVRWETGPTTCLVFEEWVNSRIYDPSSCIVQLSALSYIERLAASFALLLNAHSCDPLLVRLTSFLIADESFHSGDVDQLNVSMFEIPAAAITSFLLSPKSTTISSSTYMEIIRLVKDYSATWLPASLWDDLDVDTGRGWGATAARLLDRTAIVARDARAFLYGLRTENAPVPPAGLAVEWMIAGLRGRGDQPESRKRWISEERAHP